MTDGLTPWISLSIAVFLNAAANILIKAGTPGFGPEFDFATLWKMGQNPYILAGIASFGAALAFYALALTRIELSIGYPIMVSLGILIVFFWSVFFFEERSDWSKIIGTVLVLVGVLLLARGG